MKLFVALLVLGSVISSKVVVSDIYDPEKSQNVTKYSRDSFIVSLLNDAESLIARAKKHTSAGIGHYDIHSTHEKPMDCFEIYKRNPAAKSGIYKIWPRSRVLDTGIGVYCDMDDDGGSWTVLQRRGEFNSSEDNFFRDWAAYKTGFGDLMKDFWLGNDNIFALTNQRANSVKFILADWEGNTAYATYEDFWIDDEINNYTLHIKSFRGTAGNSLMGANGVPFTTKDRDNDFYERNCAEEFKGAWWYTKCLTTSLNGMHLKGVQDIHGVGMIWKSFRGLFYSLKDTAIKIRPKHFKMRPDVRPQ